MLRVLLLPGLRNRNDKGPPRWYGCDPFYFVRPVMNLLVDIIQVRRYNGLAW